MKMKTSEIIQIYTAFLSLDGVEKIVGDAKNGKTIKEFYKLSGKVRWNIAKNLNILEAYIKSFNKIRNDLIKQISNGEDEINPDDKEKIKEFVAEINKIDEEENDVSGLLQIDLSELNLDENQIPSSTLMILDKFIKEEKVT